MDARTQDALKAANDYLTSCYPGWTNAAITSEPKGAEFLAVRNAVSRSLSTGNADAALIQNIRSVLSASRPCDDAQEIADTMPDGHLLNAAWAKINSLCEAV